MAWKLICGLIMVVSSVLSGCESKPPPEPLALLAGSELKDMTTLLATVEQAAGVRFITSYSGTLDGVEKILNGEPYDLAWFSHGKYLTLLQGTQGRIHAQEKIMLSPVVLGVKASAADAWGWTHKPGGVTWRDVVARASAGDLRFAMTDPTASNSGFSTLIGLTAALADRGDAIVPADIDNRVITEFFRGQKLTAGSSGWLAETYVREQDGLNGIFNYESVLMQLNSGGDLREPLTLIYPVDGVITADYPLMLLNPAKRAAYQRVVEVLRSPQMQQEIMRLTQRRPVLHQVPLDAQFNVRILLELPLPGQIETIDAILFAYQDVHRRPSHALFVLDISGSMDGPRIQQLRQALIDLTGADPSLSGRFARFRRHERVSIIPFSSGVRETQLFEIGEAGVDSPAMAQIRAYVSELRVGGGTAIYSALQRAYQVAEDLAAEDPNRFYSIVLMTDGENNQGVSAPQFVDWFQAQPAEVQGIRTFAVLFGEANERELAQIAGVTGGRVFDGRGSLTQVFKVIRGYQ